MKRIISTRRLALSALAAAVLACGSGAAVALAQEPGAPLVAPVFPASENGVHPGFTKPSVEHKLTFQAPGLIREVPVKLGDRVKQDQVLASIDDEIEQKELERLKLEAESSVKIDAAKADLEAKKVVLGRKEQMFKDNVGSQSELDEARLDVVFREAQVKVAELEQSQAKIKVEQQKLKIKQLQLQTKFDGVVQVLDVHPGEMADPNKKDVIVVVKNDPLWVEVKVWNNEAAKLKLGEELQVQYEGENKWMPAKVIFMEPYADPQSNTRKLNLELANGDGRAAGVGVRVRLPSAVADAAAREQNAAVAPSAR